MTIHVHGTVVTQYGVAANNRGENEGNLTTLQKVLWKGELHTSVSAEAIRFAMRYYWQTVYDDTKDEILRVNRRWNEDSQDYTFEDQAFSKKKYIDDDVMGYMDAKAAQAEKEDEEGEEEKKPAKKQKGTTNARRGALEVSRAISLYPYFGETSFNARGGQKGKTSLYATEMHATSYQYSFSFTPTQLEKPERASAVLDAIGDLAQVGGNQGRFLYDFSPQAVVFRITHDPAPRILYVFNQEVGGPLQLSELIRRTQVGDIAANELIVGGLLESSEAAVILRDYGAQVFNGVRDAVVAAKERIGKEV
ncbi:CRISPR-associated protein Cas7/Cst2/DevR [[Clostridium] ultunense Esp]|uniref:DevR family CRISPR-associated autoregulator n=1 Tax=Thermicanus aegyptius TaxID=94009 RepID=UPI0002B70465|nr:DevR family CRISPR-associated autoregulator [Thermicanus aegyptius]CCQ92534.1 CRISPR-associated protein Cas7/Cst2/DevR [[Clostridium] ultunense Esp]